MLLAIFLLDLPALVLIYLTTFKSLDLDGIDGHYIERLHVIRSGSTVQGSMGSRSTLQLETAAEFNANKNV